MGDIDCLVLLYTLVNKNLLIDLYIVILNLQASPSRTICSDIESLQIDDEFILYIMICKEGRSF